MRRDAASMHDWERIFSGHGARGTDRTLLDRFAARRDGEAFESVVRRHGPMVLGVCRRILADPHDADDAFQATFLVLILRSGRIGDADRLGPWLHGVASRVALKARGRSARRKDRPSSDSFGPAGIDVGRPDPPSDLIDVMPLVDLEIASLSAKLRDVVVACLVEGDSAEQVARRLDCPVGTVKSRLARGREALKAGLTRRGVAPSAAVAALGAVAPSPAPATLIGSTLALATSATVPGSLAPLTQGAAAAMISKSSLIVASILGAATLVGVGLAVPVVRPAETSTPSAPTPASAAESSTPQRRNESLKNIRITMLGFHLFHSEHNRFPAAAIASADGKPLLSWRVAILPYLGNGEYASLYKEFRLDEPWDGPHNKPLLARMPAVFATPHSPAPAGKTRFRGYSGVGTMFDRDGVPINAVTDGTANTLMIVSTDAPANWTEPGEIDDEPFTRLNQSVTLLDTLDKSDPDRKLIAFADGSAYFAGPFNPASMRALVTRNGGEVVDRPSIAAEPAKGPEAAAAGSAGNANLPPGAGARNQSLKNLRLIVLGFHQYANVHDRFPAAATYSPEGRPLLSWRVAILPFLGDEAARLHKEFRLDEAWDGPHNKTLIGRMPAVFATPHSPTNPGKTRLRGFSGSSTMFGGDGTLLNSVIDGMSNTILLTASKFETDWTRPGEVAFDTLARPGEEASLLYSLDDSDPDRRLISFADGSAYFSNPPDGVSLRALLTRNGGEVVDRPAPAPEPIAPSNGSRLASAASDPDPSAPSVPLGLTGREVASTLDVLKQVGGAVWGYENAHGYLPPAATYSADGKPLLSWRVAILPHLGDEAAKLYNEFRQDEAWDGPHNRTLIDRIPDVYRISYRPTPKGMTRIRGFGGAMTMFPKPGDPSFGGPGVKVAEVPDGTSNTILCVVASEPTPWTKPGEIDFDPTLTGTWQKLLDSLESSLSGKRLMLITDGRVIDAVPPDATTLRNLITRNGGEVVQLPESADKRSREMFEAMQEDKERAEPLKVENRAPYRPSTEERLDRLESKVDRLIDLLESKAGGKPRD